MLLLQIVLQGTIDMKASGNLKNNYFSTRVVSLWNKLDEDSIHANTADKFKINPSKYGYLKLRVKSGYYTNLGLLNQYK